MLRINNLYDNQGTKFRILSEFANGYIWINIESDAALPEYIEYSLLIELIEQGTCVLADDPFKDLASIFEEPTSKNAIKRDGNFQLIQPIITHAEFHNPSIRGDLINTILANHKVTKQTIYRLLRRYWQRGQIPNALLPAYTSKRKDGKERQVGEKKLGRPRIYSEKEGITLDDNIKRLFRQVISKYLLTKKRRLSLTLIESFSRFISLYILKVQMRILLLFGNLNISMIKNIASLRKYFSEQIKKYTTKIFDN